VVDDLINIRKFSHGTNGNTGKKKMEGSTEMCVHLMRKRKKVGQLSRAFYVSDIRHIYLNVYHVPKAHLLHGWKTF